MIGSVVRAQVDEDFLNPQWSLEISVLLYINSVIGILPSVLIG